MIKTTLSFQVYLPESLGWIENPLVRIRIRMHEKWKELKPISAEHIGRYESLCGQEWPRIFRDDNTEISEYKNFEASVFYFSVKVPRNVVIHGEYFLTFTSWKGNVSTDYHTEKKHFLVADKFSCW